MTQLGYKFLKAEPDGRIVTVWILIAKDRVEAFEIGMAVSDENFCIYSEEAEEKKNLN